MDERRVLTGLLDGRRQRGYPFGVSLMAVLRREQEKPYSHYKPHRPHDYALRRPRGEAAA